MSTSRVAAGPERASRGFACCFPLLFPILMRLGSRAARATASPLGSIRACGESAGWPRIGLLRLSAACGAVRKAQFEEGRDSTGQGAGSQPGAARRRKVQQRADRRWAGPGVRSQARVKRCGKSAPSPGATPTDRQTPPGARPSRDRAARPKIPGRPLRWMATPTAAADGQNPAYRPTHRCCRLRCCRFGTSVAEVGRVVVGRESWHRFPKTDGADLRL